MNKEQAKKEFEKIINDCNEKSDLITKEAKEKGIWKPGLDSNKELFIELHKETKKKIKELYEMIDE